MPHRKAETIRRSYQRKYQTVSLRDVLRRFSHLSEDTPVLYFKIALDRPHSVHETESTLKEKSSE